MENQEDKKIEENFKELLNEVSKIGEVIQELPIEENNSETDCRDESEESDESEDSNEIDASSKPNVKQTQVQPVTQVQKFVPSDNNLEEYVYNSATSLINSSLFTLDKVKKSVSSVMDHRELTALAELIKATTSSIDVLNKVVVENKKMKNAREIKKMDIDAKKEIGNTKIKNQTNILVASREEVLKQLVSNTLDKNNIIDISVDDFTVENSK